jgi:hypothetical protein
MVGSPVPRLWGPGMPLTSTRNPFAMLPANPLKSSSVMESSRCINSCGMAWPPGRLWVLIRVLGLNRGRLSAMGIAKIVESLMKNSTVPRQSLSSAETRLQRPNGIGHLSDGTIAFFPQAPFRIGILSFPCVCYGPTRARQTTGRHKKVQLQLPNQVLVLSDSF